MSWKEFFIHRKRGDLSGAELDQHAQKHMRSGEKFAKKYRINTHIPLEGNDRKLLHLMIGTRLLNSWVDNSKDKKTIKLAVVGDEYRYSEDVWQTETLREEVRAMEEYISGFVTTSYQGGSHRSWSIRAAVSDLFLRTMAEVNGYVKHVINDTAVEDWARHWRPRILDPQASSS